MKPKYFIFIAVIIAIILVFVMQPKQQAGEAPQVVSSVQKGSNFAPSVPGDTFTGQSCVENTILVFSNGLQDGTYSLVVDNDAYSIAAAMPEGGPEQGGQYLIDRAAPIVCDFVAKAYQTTSVEGFVPALTMGADTYRTGSVRSYLLRSYFETGDIAQQFENAITFNDAGQPITINSLFANEDALQEFTKIVTEKIAAEALSIDGDDSQARAFMQLPATESMSDFFIDGPEIFVQFNTGQVGSKEIGQPTVNVRFDQIQDLLADWVVPAVSADVRVDLPNN